VIHKYSLFKLPSFLYSLPTQVMGSKIYSFEQVDSTNQVAIALAQKGAPEGTAVVSDRQYRGRGQRGRTWYSPSGVGIYLSLILRPNSSLGNISQLTLLAAVATAECIKSATGLNARVKWPNDVVYNARKLAGILVEAQWEGETVKHLIIGIGINVNHTQDMFSEQGVPGATSIAMEMGREFSREELIRELLINLERWYLIYLAKGFDPLWSKLREIDCTPGGWVEVVSLGNRFEGEVVGIDKDASLLVRTGEVVHRVTQGRITLRYGQYQQVSTPDF
jgi:BirA family biotin operon repressor/biotin-[acetyl-CoA-carboxylase] ligase